MKIVNKVNYRACYANGKKALFHKWEDKETPIIKLNTTLSSKGYKKFLENLENLIFPCETEITTHKATFAIVEFEDGTIAEVEPSAIRFIDSIFMEYDFRENINNEL